MSYVMRNSSDEEEHHADVGQRENRRRKVGDISARLFIPRDPDRKIANAHAAKITSIPAKALAVCRDHFLRQPRAASKKQHRVQGRRRSATCEQQDIAAIDDSLAGLQSAGFEHFN